MKLCDYDKYGFRAPKMSEHWYPHREREIMAWLHDYVHGYGGVVEGFVILDDERNWKQLTQHLIQTHCDEGLIEQHLDQAVHILTNIQPQLI